MICLPLLGGGKARCLTDLGAAAVFAGRAWNAADITHDGHGGAVETLHPLGVPGVRLVIGSGRHSEYLSWIRRALGLTAKCSKFWRLFAVDSVSG